MIEIAELNTEEEYRRAFPLMHQLRPYLTEERFLEITGQMVWDGYRLFAAREGDEYLALAGVGVCLNLYHGRHLWVYDLVTRSDRRSTGIGRRLMEFLEQLARQENCEHVALVSNVQRKDAHRFYEEKLSYDRASYLFLKKL